LPGPSKAEQSLVRLETSPYRPPSFWSSISADSYEDDPELPAICLARLSIRLARDIRCLIELAQEIKITPRQTTNSFAAQV
jgi:hypothetical protein